MIFRFIIFALYTMVIILIVIYIMQHDTQYKPILLQFDDAIWAIIKKIFKK